VAIIRPYEPRDLDDLYRVCLATGDNGADATHLYDDPRLVGHIYAAPYGVLSPETAFVVEDAAGVAGYIVGALDTRAFAAHAEASWWPTLRPLYPDPSGTPFEAWSADQLRGYMIHHPSHAPDALLDRFPSHLHINLLPRLQGRGLGRRLFDLWFETLADMGSIGAHLGVSGANIRAQTFYRAYGLTEPLPARPPPRATLWFARRLITQ
jgi:ribosomal protein S18 acetylase RimI-like enzyme